MSQDPVEPSPARPRGVLVIAVVLVLEALAAAALAALSVVAVIGGDAVPSGQSTFITALLALTATALVALATKLVAGYRWPRSPALVVQLFLVILAFPYFSAGNPVLGLLFLVPAAVAVVTLFSRPVLDFTVRTTGSGRML